MRADSTAAPAPVPPATRLRRWRWRDARLLLGLALIVASMLGGARLLSSGQDTVTVWQAVRDLAPGAPPVVQPVSVPLGPVTAAYASVDTPAIGRMRVPVAAGALVPVDAFGPLPAAPTRRVTVPVDPLHAPVGMTAGDVVDVWSTPATDAAVAAPPVLVLADVLVAEADGATIGVGGQIAAVLEVPADDVDTIVTALRTGVIDLVEVPATGVSS